jgi:hypothetical protein
MPDYKVPATRKTIKSKIKKLLIDWVDENLDDTGETVTVWDDAHDSAERTYQDEIEDGKSHTAAQKEAKLRFWEELQAALETTIGNVFEELSE